MNWNASIAKKMSDLSPSEIGALFRGLRKRRGTGNPGIPTKCRCGVECPSRRAAIDHCRGAKRGGRPRIPAPCPRCNQMCETTRAAIIHCRTPRKGES